MLNKVTKILFFVAALLLHSEDYEEITGKLFYRYILPDSVVSDTSSVLIEKDANISDNGDLRRSGVIYRGISFNNTSGAGIISGLNLELNGKLSDNMEISAFVSDDNMAVSEEGSTESLKDIENIYIQFRHPRFFSRMGNFSIDYDSGEFGKLESSLSGALLNTNVKEYSAEGFVSAGRTEYSSAVFTGMEGLTGPYLIRNSADRTGYEIEPGSETVWLNGKKLSRGSEYYFDNLNAELYFLAGTPVHDGDRIMIDFRYFTSDYNNITYGFDTKARLNETGMKIGFNYYQTSDIKDKPVSFDMSDEIKEMLQNSGSEYILASGGVFTPDEGDYDLIEPDSIYVYRGSGNGDYTVRFSYFETGGEYKIDYDSTGTSFFVHDAVNGGNYLPLIKIEAPNSYSRMHLSGTFLSERISIESEFAASALNKNLYSSSETEFNGLGDRQMLSFSTGKGRLGEFKINLSRKFYNEELVLPSRLKEVLEDEDIDDSDMNTGGDYLRYGFGLDHKIGNDIANNYSIFYLDKGGSFFENGHKISSYLRKRNYYYKADISFYKAENDSIIKEKKSLFFNPGFTGNLWSFGPYLRGSTSSKNINGISDKEISSKLGNHSAYNSSNTLLSHDFEYGRIGLENNDPVERYTNTVKVEKRLGSVMSTDAVWTNVKVDRADSSNVNYDMINIRLNYNKESRYRVFCEYGTEITNYYRKIRTYYKVDEGTGQFVFVDGEYYPDDFGDFSYYINTADDPSEAAGVRLTAKSFFDFPDSEDRSNILYWLSRIDIEQDIEIEEKSGTDKTSDVIFLNLRTFQNDSTITGIIDSRTGLYLLKNSKFSADYSLHYRKSLYREFMNYSDNSLIKEHYMSFKRIFGDFTHKISGKLERKERYSFTDIKMDDLSNNYASYNIRHSIRPDLIWSVEIEYGREYEDIREVTSNSYRMSPGLSAGFFKYGIFRAGIDVIKVDSYQEIPFSMNAGLGKGMSYKWRSNADYRFGKRVLGSFLYSGRFLSYDKKPFHELRIEFRMEL